MAKPDHTPDPDEAGGMLRWLALAIGGLLLLVAGWYVYSQMTATTGVKVEAPPPAVVAMVPPPPPPPPPPPQPHPPEPQDKPNPVPNPVEQKSAPAPVSINGPAQAGSDAFGLQSGNGGGMGTGAGTCTGSFCGGGPSGPPMSEQFYNRYIDGLLTERLAADRRLNRLAFTLDVGVTISPSGRVTQVTILKSSGSSDRDKLVREILLAISDLDSPPAGMRFPQRYRVKGKRPT